MPSLRSPRLRAPPKTNGIDVREQSAPKTRPAPAKADGFCLWTGRLIRSRWENQCCRRIELRKQAVEQRPSTVVDSIQVRHETCNYGRIGYPGEPLRQRAAAPSHLTPLGNGDQQEEQRVDASPFRTAFARQEVHGPETQRPMNVAIARVEPDFLPRTEGISRTSRKYWRRRV